MGSGASGLSSAQAASVSKEIRDKYEQLKLEGLSDIEIQTKLTDDYNKFIATCQAQPVKETAKVEPPPKVEVKSTTPKSALSKKMVSGESTSGKQGGLSKNTSGKGNATPSRRKSFDTANKKVAAAINSVVASDLTTPIIPENSSSTESTKEASDPILMQSRTSPTLPVMTEVVDSWDSVSAQPFCVVCQMAFKSPAFLERHVKYSDIHTRNLKMQAEAVERGELNDFSLPGFGSTASTKFIPKQIEGQHYKCLYTGSKLFWRTQETVDLNFYHHILAHSVEVISYDLVKSKEYPRQYFDYTAISDILVATGVSMSNEENTRNSITTYLLQRLQLVGGAVQFIPLSGDVNEKLKSPLQEKPPVVLIPVPVTRRRRTNAEEIDSTINSLATDRAALVAATGMAEKIANVVYSSASSIAAKKWWADFSHWRRKWIWAIRKIIRQKLVAETKMVLLELAVKKEVALKGDKLAKRNSIIMGSPSRPRTGSREV